jgi:hypothetical protein
MCTGAVGTGNTLALAVACAVGEDEAEGAAAGLSAWNITKPAIRARGTAIAVAMTLAAAWEFSLGGSAVSAGRRENSWAARVV